MSIRQPAIPADEMEAFLRAQEAKKERAAAVKEAGPKEFIVSRTPEGLYEVAYSGGGLLPEMLKGRFTGANKVRDLIARYKQNKNRD